MKFALPLVGLAMITAPAIAQDGPPRGPAQPSTRVELETMVKDRFTATDTSKDGFIDKAEADAARAATGGPPEGGPGGRGGRGMLERADADGDGKVSLAEALAPALARFDATDTDKNGTISDEERQAARERMRAMWQSQQQSPEMPQQ